MQIQVRNATFLFFCKKEKNINFAYNHDFSIISYLRRKSR